jgi:hypothetical protein
MGTPNIAVPTTRALQIIQKVSAASVLTNTGTALLYLDDQSSCSAISNDFTLLPGQTIQWAAATECWALADSLGISSLSVAGNVDQFSSVSGNNGAQTPIIASIAAVFDAGSGHMRSALPAPPANSAYWISRITVNMSVSVNAYVYIGAVSNANIVDGTSSGQLDTADYAVPLYVPSGNAVTVDWITGAGTGSARFEYVVKAAI